MNSSSDSSLNNGTESVPIIYIFFFFWEKEWYIFESNKKRKKSSNVHQDYQTESFKIEMHMIYYVIIVKSFMHL